MKAYSAEEVFAYAGGDLTRLTDILPGWERTLETFPAGGLPFLKEENWSQARKECGFGAETDVQLGRVAALIAGDERLSLLAWHTFLRYTTPGEGISYMASHWPEPVQLGEDGGLLYLLVALGFVPLVWKHHAALGIPKEITLDSLKKFREHSDIVYRQDHGKLGLASERMGWLSRYHRDPLFRLGRMEYELAPTGNNFYFWRRISDGASLVFPQDGVQFTMQGNQLTRHEPAATPVWTSCYRETDERVTGTPYAPMGFAVNRIVTLNKSEWECLNRPGDYVARMHIPYGGGMTPVRCRTSLEQVKPFFDQYFPATPVRVICTSSWIFGNQLEQVMPYESNLLDLERNVYLLPNPSGPEDGLGFIFPLLATGAPFVPETAPRDTDLRRRVLDFIHAGGRWRVGAMCIAAQDTARYGQELYRRQWAQLNREWANSH